MTEKSTKKAILVIEDERPLLEVINAKLEKNGFTVIAARSVEQAFNAHIEKNDLGVITVRTIEQALDYLEQLERIDAVWLDHHLVGKEDGLDFVKKFKANGGRWNKIPVFVVSNAANPATVKSYKNSGVSRYYVKSDHRLDEIIADIESFLARPMK
ncbi:MAG TPA: response regulator [Candidatus Paceibacterota bacterium]|nr:response regulator [Candidatus Paceibacterota bacterium]